MIETELLERYKVKVARKTCKGPFTCVFWWDFWRTLQCNFCGKCKLTVISLRFRCDIRCNLPNTTAKLHEVSSMNSKPLQYRSNKLPENRLWFTLAIFIPSSSVTKIALKSGTKNAQKNPALRQLELGQPPLGGSLESTDLRSHP